MADYCVTITKKGSPCRNRCKYDGHCGTHRPLPECSICYEQISLKNKVETSCKHLFHSKCLGEWKLRDNNSCPLCRTELEKIVYVEKVVQSVIIDPLPEGQMIISDENGFLYINYGDPNIISFQIWPEPEGWTMYTNEETGETVLLRNIDLDNF